MFDEETPCGFYPTNNLNSIPQVLPEEVVVMGFPQADHTLNDMDDLEPRNGGFNPEEDSHYMTSLDHAHLIQEMIQQDPNNNHILSYTEIQDLPDSSSIQPTQDLLNLFHLPPPIQFLPDHAAVANTVMFDPLFHLNAQLTPHSPSPLMREIFQSFPGHGCFLSDSPSTTLFGNGGVDDNNIVGEGSSGLMMFPQHHHQLDGDGRNKFEGGVFDFGRDMAGVMGKVGRERKDTKHYTTDREKRCQMNDRYFALKSLIPNPTKTDRASIVGDAIEYIQELIRTVRELELLVSKKRCGRRERVKRARIDDNSPSNSGNTESCITKTAPDDVADQSSYNSTTLRTSWLQRKSKVTEVDVRIIDDEVTIKLVQRKKINCLLYVSRVLDELQLDLHHVAGGQIGEHHSFLFNSKIKEGSSVYASAIASKLMEAVDSQYAIGNHQVIGSF